MKIVYKLFVYLFVFLFVFACQLSSVVEDNLFTKEDTCSSWGNVLQEQLKQNPEVLEKFEFLLSGKLPLFNYTTFCQGKESSFAVPLTDGYKTESYIMFPLSDEVYCGRELTNLSLEEPYLVDRKMLNENILTSNPYFHFLRFEDWDKKGLIVGNELMDTIKSSRVNNYIRNNTKIYSKSLFSNTVLWHHYFVIEWELYVEPYWDGGSYTIRSPSKERLKEIFEREWREIAGKEVGGISPTVNMNSWKTELYCMTGYAIDLPEFLIFKMMNRVQIQLQSSYPGSYFFYQVSYGYTINSPFGSEEHYDTDVDFYGNSNYYHDYDYSPEEPKTIVDSLWDASKSNLTKVQKAQLKVGIDKLRERYPKMPLLFKTLLDNEVKIGIRVDETMPFGSIKYNYATKVLTFLNLEVMASYGAMEDWAHVTQDNVYYKNGLPSNRTLEFEAKMFCDFNCILNDDGQACAALQVGFYGDDNMQILYDEFKQRFQQEGKMKSSYVLPYWVLGQNWNDASYQSGIFEKTPPALLLDLCK